MYIALAIVAVIFIVYISISNSINRNLNKIEEAKSSVEIHLAKRYDVIKNSFEVAKGYLKHEEKVFTSLRSVSRGMSAEEINEVVSNQDKALKTLFALGESYPELRSAEMFTNLQKQLSEENAQFSAAKRALNSNITIYNNQVVSFPSSVICSMKGLSKMDFIHEENLEAKKEISFDWGE